ncbi:MAG TPA: hypothetical protein VN783_01070, partial [Thermoanaerobaculia bacterium]|nr:hypothetical protein [Thermoanaerobaculia bacterium]
ESGSFSAERRDRQFALLDAAQSATLDIQNWQDFWKCLMRAGFRSSALRFRRTGQRWSIRSSSRSAER